MGRQSQPVRRSAVPVALALVVSTASCAHGPPEPPLPVPAAGPAADGASAPETSAMSALEGRLNAFRAERAGWWSMPARPDGPWPLPVLTGWRRLLTDLDPIWRSRLSGAELVRTYVILEAELHLTSGRFGPPPDVVAEALIQTRVELAERRGWRPSRRRREDVVEWPVSPIIVTSGFGVRRDPVHGGRSFHAGIDLGGRHGDPVNTAAPGMVVAAGWYQGYGRRVVVRHGSGLETWYGHLSRILVRAGDRLYAGDTVGLMGESGRTTGPHLHFEIRREAEPVDPQDWLGRRLSDARAVEISRR